MKNKATTLALLALVLISIQAVPVLFDGNIELGILENYANPDVPAYVFLEETHTEDISDEIATLGRVLFYDKKLSLNESISCASCHQQEFAFGDTLVASPGFDKKLTERRSTRLVNLNYNHMPEVFWDRRAVQLDSLPLMVLSNSIEMGFSGENGQPPIDSLVRRIEHVDYYDDLFKLAYGINTVTKERVNLALTQFVRSIVSYDSKYDVGRSMVQKSTDLFPNFSYNENLGKDIYFSKFSVKDSTLRRMGCADCHGIDNFTTRKTSLTGNNGIVGVIGHPEKFDTTVKRSPSLRDLVNPAGIEIGPFMHDGSLATLDEVMDHYSKIGLHGHPRTLGLHTSLIISIDRPVTHGSYTGPATGAAGPSGIIAPTTTIPPLQPRLNQTGKDLLVAFLKTLTGNKIYTDPKWSDPFDAFGNIKLTNDCDKLLQSTVEVEICEGEVFEGFHTAGTHYKRIKNEEGCDSLITIELKLKQLVEIHEEVTICSGERYRRYSAAGRYVDVFPSATGCDTLKYLDLTTIPMVRQNRTEWICPGTDFEGHTEEGEYRDTIPNEYGPCFKEVTTRLRLKSLPIKNSFVEICTGESYEGYTESKWLYDTLHYANTCDTVHRTQLYVTNEIRRHLTVGICEGETYEGHTEAGVYKSVHQATGGCDSVITLYLRVETPRAYEKIETICEGEEFWGYTESGSYQVPFDSQGAICRPYYELQLTVLPSSESYEQINICEGENYLGYTTTGLHSERLENVAGCDSIIYIDLNVLAPTESLITKEICDGDNFYGYTQAGTYQDYFINTAGCDSIRELNLAILPNSETHIEMALCQGDSFEGYSTTGTYTDVFANHTGCDSIRYIHLEILQHSEATISATICEGESFEGYIEDGLYEDAFRNAEGCDSLRAIDLTILKPSSSYAQYSICEGTELWGYNSAGLHTDVLTNAAGCDSLRQLDLHILEHTINYEEVHLCPGEIYEGRAVGEYEELYTNAAGCDSIRHVRLINIAEEDALCVKVNKNTVLLSTDTDYIQVGPNPTTDFIYIHLLKPKSIPADLKIVSANQQQVFQQTLTQEETRIELSAYDSGLYLIQIKQGDKMYLTKLLKI